MKFFMAFFASILLALAMPAQSIGVVVEEFAVHDSAVGSYDLTGMTTFRVYVKVENPDDKVAVVLGLDLLIPFAASSEGGSFFQHPQGSGLGSEIWVEFFDDYPALAYDSWVTIDMENNASVGELSACGNALLYLEGWESGSGDLVMSFGGINANNTTNGIAGSDLKVLIGQFTTNGELSGSLNVITQMIGDNPSSATSTYFFNSNNALLGGCIDTTACNYNPCAGTNDGSCLFNCDLSGDFNHNGSVGADDITILLATFGCTNNCGEYDLNGDGMVSIQDLVQLLGLLGTF